MRNPNETLDALIDSLHLSILGTDWVAPGEGSTWRELCEAFNRAPARHFVHGYSLPILWQLFFGRPHRQAALLAARTNLLLTGAPLTDYDRQRWESGNVE